AIAQALAEAGADLVLVGRTAASLEAARDDLAALGRRVELLTADVGDPEAAARACGDALASGPIDILVNNVGGRREDIPTAQMPLDAWRRLVDLNLTSAVACTTAVVGPMLERGWGRVVNVASIAGPVIAFKGIQGRHYEAAKAGLVGYTRAAAADWAGRGVTVNAVCPGVFFTDPNRRWAGERPGWREAVEANIPAGRMGEAEEIGPLVLYLCGPGSAYMTGAVLVIDGGYTLW
ncbi:MAG: SDR family NAD(P)-dependent oxidoreductase, partial [Gemmataceae bacterium]